MKHVIALAAIRFGFWLLDKETHDEVLRLMGIAGRKGII